MVTRGAGGEREEQVCKEEPVAREELGNSRWIQKDEEVCVTTGV